MHNNFAQNKSAAIQLFANNLKLTKSNLQANCFL